MNTQPGLPEREQSLPELAVDSIEGPTTEQARIERHNGQIARAEGNVALNDATPDTPFIASNAMAAAIHQEEDRKRKEQQVSLLKEARKILDRIAHIDRQIDALENERDELEQKVEVAQDALDRLERGDALEINEDGELADPDLEAMVREYEERTGRKVDRTNNDVLYDVIHAMQGFYYGRISEIDLDIDALKSERDELSNDLIDLDRTTGFSASAMSYSITEAELQAGQGMVERLVEIHKETEAIDQQLAQATPPVNNEPVEPPSQQDIAMAFASF